MPAFPKQGVCVSVCFFFVHMLICRKYRFDWVSRRRLRRRRRRWRRLSHRTYKRWADGHGQRTDALIINWKTITCKCSINWFGINFIAIDFASISRTPSFSILINEFLANDFFFFFWISDENVEKWERWHVERRDKIYEWCKDVFLKDKSMPASPSLQRIIIIHHFFS